MKVDAMTARRCGDAFDAESGAVYLNSDGKMLLIRQLGEWKNEAKLSVPLQSEGLVIGTIALGVRRHGTEYTADDRQAMQEIGILVARAIALAKRRDGVKA